MLQYVISWSAVYFTLFHVVPGWYREYLIWNDSCMLMPILFVIGIAIVLFFIPLFATYHFINVK